MKRLFLVGIVSTLTFLCIFAPAQLLGSVLSQFTHGRLNLASTQGSLWHGNAYLLLNSMSSPADDATQPNSESINLGKVSWDTQALQLLSGRLSVNLTWNDGAPFWLTLDPSRLHIEHAAFNLPTEVIPALVPTLKAAQLGGQLAVRCENFSVTRTEILGQLDIDWNQASSPLSTVNPLGSYHTRLDGRGNVMEMKLESPESNPLIMQGNGQWSMNDGLHFDGSAEANAAYKDKLQELLRVLGNEASAGSGRYQLKF